MDRRTYKSTFSNLFHSLNNSKNKIWKYENKSTLNVDGWEQGITADKIKQALNNFKACSDKTGTVLISTPDIQIEKIVKSLGFEMPNLTTIAKIDKFKNQLNKDIFMLRKLCGSKKTSQSPENTGKNDAFFNK